MNGKKSDSDKDSQNSDLLNSKAGTHLDKDEQIIQLQRKLKALKEAFIKERETKVSLERELLDLKKRSESHEAALREKENNITRLQSENSQLQDKLMLMKSKNDNLQNQSTFKSSIANSGSTKQSFTASLGSTIGNSLGEVLGMKKGGEDEFKRLQQEYNYLKKQFETVKEKLIKTDEEKETLRKDLKKEFEALKARASAAEEDLQRKSKELENSEKEFRTLSQAHSALKDVSAKQESDLQYLKNRSDTLERERNLYKASDEDKSKMISELNQLINQLESKIKILNEKLMSLDQTIRDREEYIIEMEAKYQVFSVTLKGPTDIPAQILLRKDVEGDFILDIETAEARKVILPYQVTSISPSKEVQNQFAIAYRLKPNKTETETFETKDLTKLLKSLKKFMENAREKSKTEPIITGGSDSGQKKDKKFFAEIASFFGS